jgi:hypothetical protein
LTIAPPGRAPGYPVVAVSCVPERRDRSLTSPLLDDGGCAQRTRRRGRPGRPMLEAGRRNREPGHRRTRQPIDVLLQRAEAPARLTWSTTDAARSARSPPHHSCASRVIFRSAMRFPGHPLRLMKAAVGALGLRATADDDGARTRVHARDGEPAPAGTLAPAAAEAALPTSRRPSERDALLAELVEQRPGIIVAEAAAQISVHPTALYPIIRRLEISGQIVKLGRELHPPGTPGTEQLRCEEGHVWTRPTVRGRKPRRCPRHR